MALPRYQSLADSLQNQIETGVLRVGERLPGVRTLAQQRAVSVATAVMAYRRLEETGWLEARERSGFYVRPRPVAQTPEPRITRPALRPRPVTGQNLVLDLIRATQDPSMVQFGAAVPAADYLPSAQISRALADAARTQRVASTAYLFPPGEPGLLRQLARRLGETGWMLESEALTITTGCQEALSLALRATTRPGDVIAIESPTFYGLLQVAESLGLEAIEIPNHPRDGLALDALALALERWPVKACVVTPNFSNPLGCLMPVARKRALLAMLAAARIPLIEDDIYGDLGFARERPPPCGALQADADVLYCGSVSKTLAPGLRVGWIAAGRHREKVEYLKFLGSLANPSLPQFAVAALLESGRYERHLRTIRQRYSAAVERMHDALARHFPAETRVSRPAGGFVVWIELPTEIDATRLAQRALEHGISVAPGPIFSATRKYRNCLRLSCACVWNTQTERALATLARLMLD